MHSRLHHRFWIEFAQLDAISTRADDPDGAGPLTGGFDDDFGELLVFTTPAGARQSTRQDKPSVFVPCNIASEKWEVLQQLMAGNSPDTSLQVIASRYVLQQMLLINPDNGECLIRVNDRALSVRDRCRNTVMQFRQPFYVTQVRPTFGIAETPDLIVFTLEDRENFPRGAS